MKKLKLTLDESLERVTGKLHAFPVEEELSDEPYKKTNKVLVNSVIEDLSNASELEARAAKNLMLLVSRAEFETFRRELADAGLDIERCKELCVLAALQYLDIGSVLHCEEKNNG